MISLPPPEVRASCARPRDNMYPLRNVQRGLTSSEQALGKRPSEASPNARSRDHLSVSARRITGEALIARQSILECQLAKSISQHHHHQLHAVGEVPGPATAQ